MAAPAQSRSQLLTHPGARAAMKARLAFATERWGGTGTLFAWDLYNEMHPPQGENRIPDCFDDLSTISAPGCARSRRSFTAAPTCNASACSAPADLEAAD